ncbi:MAG TPA: ATP12 family protein [Acetobacteraceae bacterium]|nr:ATP12 family protein [Acetobacteraceae bacterium]
MKRFWDRAEVAEGPDGFTVLLDGKKLRLPGGTRLVLPGRTLAEAVAAEWQQAGGAKGVEMSFADVPLTRLAGTAQDRISPDPVQTVDALAAYGESDLLCYRADAPPELARLQAQAWQPWLDWAARAHDAPLKITTGVMPVKQEVAALAALRSAVADHPPAMLAGLGLAVPSLGSLVLGLALAAGEVSATDAHALATLDERFQAGLWGEDAEAAQRRRNLADEVALAARFMALAGA